MRNFEYICLCNRCIGAIRSRGEKVFVGEVVEYDPEIPETSTCEWCEETDFDDLRLCHF